MWFKVDDSIAFHAKTVAAGNAAMGLWTRAGAWCMQQTSEGRVPAHMVAALGTKQQAKALVSAGLWDETSDGYEFHDWLIYQPSAQDIKLAREAKTLKKVEAGRLGGIASGVARAKQNRSNREANDEANAKQNEAPSRPVPSPTTNPPTPSELAPPAARPKTTRRTAVPDHFPPDDETAAKCAEWAAVRAPGVSLRAETEHWLDYHRARGNTAADWTASWRTWMTRAQKDVDRQNGPRHAPNARQGHNDQILRGVLEQDTLYGQQELSA